MILNIHKNHKNKILQTDFKENTFWTCTLISFICRLETKITESGIYCIETDLITRECNQHRILFYIYLNRGTNHFTYAPTLSAEYKLRLHDVSTAVFELSRIDKRSINLLEFSATFDIKETYARF